jgi:sulfur carrier protein ThiS
VELPEGATVRDLLARLGIPEEGPRLLLLNGHDAEASATLRAGDAVDVLPPLVGG